ncbi:MAG: InlB B-repeat-containing protein [Eubacteriales bacterium]|nr:InlB B-repeat-containing protein [Eubacteriales bacterium]
MKALHLRKSLSILLALLLVCSVAYSEEHLHTYGEWVDQGDGTQSRQCTICQYVDTAELPVQKEQQPATETEQVQEPKTLRTITYSANGVKKTVSKESFALSVIPTPEKVKLAIPEGMEFSYWSAGGKTYYAGEKFGADESQIPTTLVANWKEIVQPEPEIEVAPEGESKPDGEAKPEGENKPDGEVKPEGESKPDGEVKPEGESKPDSEVKPESESKPDGEAKPESESKPDGEAKPDDESKLDGEAKPDDESKLDGEAKPEGESKLDGEVKPEGENTFDNNKSVENIEAIPSVDSSFLVTDETNEEKKADSDSANIEVPANTLLALNTSSNLSLNSEDEEPSTVNTITVYHVGDQSKSVEYVQGQTVLSPEAHGLSIVEGQQFAGWNTQADGTGANYQVGDSIDANAVPTDLYAQFSVSETEALNIVTVYHVGDQSKSVEYASNQTIPSPEALGLSIAEGQQFDGWNTQVDGTGSVNYQVGDSIDANAVPTDLYAQFSVGETETLNIMTVYHVGDQSKSVEYASDQTVPSPEALGLPVAEGQLFEGWNRQPEGTDDVMYQAGDALDPAAVPSDLYGQFTDATAADAAMEIMPLALLDYAVTSVAYYRNGNADRDGGQPIIRADKTAADGSILAVWPGYHFVNWYDHNNNHYAYGATLPTTTKDPSGVLTLYAQWAADTGLNLPGMTISVSVDKTGAYPGDEVFYTLNVRNDSNATVAMDLWDQLPEALELIDANGGTVSNGNCKWLGISIAAGQTISRNMRARIKAGAQADAEIENTAFIASINGTEVFRSDMKIASAKTKVLRKVIYDGNGGVLKNGATAYTDTVNTGAVLRNDQLGTFERAGYRFVGWVDSKGMAAYAPGDTLYRFAFLDGPLTLVAQWTESVANLSISVTTAQNGLFRGGVANYVITIANTGTASASNVVLADQATMDQTSASQQIALQGVSHSLSKNDNNGYVEWVIGEIPAGQSVQRTISYKVLEGSILTQLSNHATITSINGIAAGGNLTSTVTTAVSSRLVVYNANGGVVGATGEQRFTSGGMQVLDNSVVNMNRAGYAFAGWNTLANGSGATRKAGEVIQDTELNQNHTYELYALWNPVYIVSIGAAANRTVVTSKELITYTVTVTNSGMAATPALVIKDTLPVNGRFVSVKLSVGTFDNNNAQWAINGLPANSSATMEIVVEANGTLTQDEKIINQASVIAIGTDPVPAGLTACATVTADVRNGDLRVTNRVFGNGASYSRDFPFTMILRNPDGGLVTGYYTYIYSDGTTGVYSAELPMEFELRHNESIYFPNLPAGTRFSVEETNHRGYSLKSYGSAGVIQGVSTAGFENSRYRNTDIPKTGYGEGSWMLLALLLPLLAAAFLLIRKPKRAKQ